MESFAVGDVLNRDPTDSLISILVLAYTSNRDAQTIVELAVLDGDVSAVCFY